MRAQRLVEVGGQLLEGPAWDASRERLLFVDIDGCGLLSLDWRTRALKRIPTAETPSAWIPRASGGSAVASRRGLRLADTDGEGDLAVEVEAAEPASRSNDAKCDPRGRLWFGTMEDEAAEGAAALYRIDPDLSVRRVLHRVTISNGLGWSPDGSRMYYVDTPTRRIDVLDYDLETGEATARRPLADVADLDGVPDGLAVDAEGCLWVAFHDGAAVRRFGPAGERLEVVPVPVPRPTSCAFCGDGLEVLVITTAHGGGGGDLYCHQPGTPGLAVAPFAA